MRRINKHAASQINIVGLTGGVNIAASGEMIDDNDMQECVNFIYGANDKKLTGRGGLSAPLLTFENKILSIFYDIDTNTYLVFLKNKKIYAITTLHSTPKYIGMLTGDLAPSCAKFQDKVWIASGEKLQFYSFAGEVTTVADSPLCDIVFERFARLVVTKTGSDYLYYSGVGDGGYWEENTNDESSAQNLEVGYGDSGDILAVVPLATDLIVIKSNGKIYQVMGEFPQWAIYNISNNADPIGRLSAVNLGSEVVFISRRGLKTLSATMDYGNIKVGDIGDKFNGLITKSLHEPAIFNLKRHGMLMIRPSADWSYFIAYNYLLGAATEIRFAFPVTSIVETGDKVVVAANDSLYYWSNEYSKDDTAPIDFRLKPKDHISTNKILIKSIDTKFSADYAGTVKVTTGSLSIDAPAQKRNKIRCNHSTSLISLSLSSNSQFTLNHIVLEIADL